MKKNEKYVNGRSDTIPTGAAKRRFLPPQIICRGRLRIHTGSMNDYDRLGMPPVRVR